MKDHHIFTLVCSVQNVYNDLFDSFNNLFNFGEYDKMVKS